MRYAIFGDIHANLEAFEAVLKHSKAEKCEEYVCLGDIVGYNADPVACLEKVKEMGCPVVKGNHDEDSTRLETSGNTNPVARESQIWTYNQLSEEQRQWLQDLRYVRQVEKFTIVHSSLDQPQQWHYITNKFDAMASMAYQFTQLCFIGHSHVPGIFVREQGVELISETSVVMEPTKKYLVNVGSVGQPRDEDWRASYCVYDSEDKSITIHRVEYDVDAAKQKILDAGLPESLAKRLSKGK